MERMCERVDRCTGRDDVIDNGEPHPIQPSANHEGISQIAVPRSGPQQCLGLGVEIPSDAGDQQRVTRLGGHPAGDLNGLIEASVKEPLAVQRHGDQSVDGRERGPCAQLSDQREPQGSTHAPCR